MADIPLPALDPDPGVFVGFQGDTGGPLLVSNSAGIILTGYESGALLMMDYGAWSTYRPYAGLVYPLVQ